MSAIVVEGLTKCFGRQWAVNPISFEVPQGSICGFLGRNGAGKTTTIKMLLGLLHPTSGSSQLLDCDSTDLTPEVRSRIGYVTEGHRLTRWMRIREIERYRKSFFRNRWDDRLFAEMIEYFELSPKQKIRHLSNGQRAQVSLALTLAPNPELLIMDDPTLGLDPVVRRQFLEGMVHLIMREGRTVLFSSHILSDVERVSDRILVIDDGVLRADCALAEFSGSVRTFILSFDGRAPDSMPIENALRCRRGEDRWEISILKSDEPALRSWAEQAGARNLQERSMTLEDQFIVFTAPRTGRRKLFSWEDRDATA
jgi:ABC-2 type transport system ATP-binding protein